MAIGRSVLAASSSSVDASSYVTANIASPPANTLLIAIIGGYNSSTTPTMAGLGLTWVQINTALSAANGRITIFRALGTPSAGTCTISVAGGDLAQMWDIEAVTGTDISGTNGSGAIVQSVPNNNSANNITVTLAALGDATNNAVMCGFIHDDNITGALGGSYTKMDEEILATEGISFTTGFKIPGTTTPSISWGTSTPNAGVAFEIKAASAGTTIYHRLPLLGVG